MSQLSCPKCHQYTVVAQNRGWIGLAWLYFVFAGWIVTASGLMRLYSSVIEGILMLAIGVGPLFFAYNVVNKTTKVQCSNCGYKWDYHNE